MKAVADEQLIQWVADGDPSCLATLFERHHRGVYRYFLQLLNDRIKAEFDPTRRLVDQVTQFGVEAETRPAHDPASALSPA
mgnify:CR=1 FL=1